MSIAAVEDILVHEENYHDEMKEKILPYINERKAEFYLCEKPDETLYCLKYVPENPCAAIVISHGFTETTAKFAEMVFYFLKADYAVYIYDHCGHGKSYRLTDDMAKVHVDRYERYVSDLLFVCRTAKADFPDLSLYLFGHSMGGGIAACAAAYDPPLFSKVVLSSPMIRPATGNFPWIISRIICSLFVRIGKGTDFAPGQGPYTGEDTFEDSAALSGVRYEFYNEIRRSNEMLQMNGATYGWLHECIRLSLYLMRKGWKKILAPVFLFQADYENFVVNSLQDIFIEKLKSRSHADMTHIENSRHEIYRSEDAVLARYLEIMFEFLNS